MRAGAGETVLELKSAFGCIFDKLAELFLCCQMDSRLLMLMGRQLRLCLLRLDILMLIIDIGVHLEGRILNDSGLKKGIWFSLKGSKE
jgi:hypothetical protein